MSDVRKRIKRMNPEDKSKAIEPIDPPPTMNLKDPPLPKPKAERRILRVPIKGVVPKTKPTFCEVLTWIDGIETTVAYVNVWSIPQRYAVLWFTQERLGSRSWRVEEVAHWVGSGESGDKPYQHIAIYAQPISEEAAVGEFYSEEPKEG